MIFLPIGLLEPGMVLARNVPSANPRLALLVSGQTLTADSIKTAAARGINGLYIESACSDDIPSAEILDPALKQEMLADIKTEFEKVRHHSAAPNYSAIGKMAESLVISVLEREQLLCSIMDIRDYDNYTYSHSLFVSIASVIAGSSLKLSASQLNDLAISGLLHDIGKLDIPLHIINKPGPLTKEEYALMQEHPMRAVQRMRNVPGCRDGVLKGVVTHHEHFDGAGYPRGLAGEKIPLFGRILAIADVYDALSSTRAYREAWSPAQIFDYLSSRSASQFDPNLLANFMKTISPYPIGSLVKLSDCSIALVIENHEGMTLRPTVRVLSPPENCYCEIDLSQGHFHITVLDAVHESVESLNLGRL